MQRLTLPALGTCLLLCLPAAASASVSHLPTRWITPSHSGRVLTNAVVTGCITLSSETFRPVAEASLPEALRARLPDDTANLLVAPVPDGVPLPAPDGIRRSDRHALGLPVVFVETDGGASFPLRPASWPDCALPHAYEPFPHAGHADKKAQTGDILVEAPDPARALRWTAEPDLQLQGYWKHAWSDSRVPATVTGGSPDGPVFLRLGEKPDYGIGATNRLRVLNALPELTQPGQYYLARAERLLFFRPPPPPFDAAAPWRVGLAVAPGVAMELHNVTNLTLRGFTFKGIRGTALKAHHCPGLRLENCTFSHIGGGSAVELLDCPGLRIIGGSVTDIADRALHLSAGTRRTLTPGDACVRDVTFARIGTLVRTYAPAILLEGCGNRIESCRFSEMPSSALRLEGNNHTVASNLFERCVLDSDDQGVIDIWGDPTYLGNRILGNTFRDVGRPALPGIPTGLGQCAVRLDDQISGTLIEGNTFARAARGRFGAIQINGGGNNLIRGNRYLDCPHAVSIQRWTEERWADAVAQPRLRERFRTDVDFRHPAWIEALTIAPGEPLCTEAPATNRVLDATPTYW